ncbi:hypothetical protein ABIF63_006126 [Bradyrhizobium japonicum]|uniref:Uncharacterized protein n=1 Tax=Bradyrhizobium japonicum TaxID=375 RepID=A0ABV2S0C3_BRAJP
MNSHIQIDTKSATPVTTSATTRELVAIHDIAATLAAVLTGLAQAPRCSGPADAWAASLLEGLRAAQSAATVALLTRTDENQMRAVAIAQSLEWAMEDEDSAALLRVVQDVASRPGAVAL